LISTGFLDLIQTGPVESDFDPNSPYYSSQIVPIKEIDPKDAIANANSNLEEINPKIANLHEIQRDWYTHLRRTAIVSSSFPCLFSSLVLLHLIPSARSTSHTSKG
jgi:hypothetical protein